MKKRASKWCLHVNSEGRFNFVNANFDRYNNNNYDIINLWDLINETQRHEDVRGLQLQIHHS
jgi:hypothetical protein